MKERPSVATVQEFFSYDAATGRVLWRVNRPGGVKAGDRAGTSDARGWRRVKFRNAQYPETHFIWVLAYGDWPPPGLQIDHVNRNPQDNSLQNLRLATAAQNRANTKPKAGAATPFKGVTRVKTGPNAIRFQAFVVQSGHRKYLGTYKTPEEAHEVAMAEHKKIWGEFSRSTA
jgi:hypothetical protein